MKKILMSIFVLYCTVSAMAQTMDQAEKLYQEGDFASAQKEYSALLPTLTGNNLFQAQLRLAACQYANGEYLTAVKTILSYPLPQDPLWKARFLLYRIQLAQQNASMYSRILEKREIENNTDPEKWTRQEWQHHIQQDYEALWKLRERLIHAPITQETLILNLKDTDTTRIPTLFDFVVEQWTQWLQHADLTLLSQGTRTYLDETATPVATHKNRANQIATLLQTAASLEGANRQNARIFWQTDFILLPFEQSAWFDIKDKSAALTKATQQLNKLSGYTASHSFWDKLKGLVRKGDTDYGQSYAAYQTAQLLFNNDERAQALAICQYAEKSLTSSYYTHQCQELTKRITQHEIAFDSLPPALQPEKPQVKMMARNIPQVYARIYPVTKSELEQFYRANHPRTMLHEWDDLTRLYEKNITELLSSTKPYQSLSQEPTYEKPYFQTQLTLKLPSLEKGFYVVMASEDANFNPQEHTVAATVINITDLALFITTGIADNPEKYVRTLTTQPVTYRPEVFRLYTFNLKTGQPLPSVPLDILTDWKDTHIKNTTTQEGILSLSRAIEVGKRTNNSHFINVWAEKEESVALSPRSTYFYFYPNEPVRLFAQTDRAIYRPGQQVYLSVQGFESTPRGMQVLAGKKVSVKVTGSQTGKQVFQTSATLNEFGTAQTDFTLPEGKELLLGHFSVQVSAQLNGEHFYAYHGFEIEEYKRPDYEITLNDPVAPLAYLQLSRVTGKASYYTGMPLADAKVNYTITRQEYIPPFYWWRSWRPTAAEQIAQGETTTNDKGEFTIVWKPEPKLKDETSTQYTVHAEVLDESGRAIETSRTYRVSTYPHLFKVDFTQGFYDENTATALADITLTNADGQPISGTVVSRVSRVQDTPQTDERNSLDAWYQAAKDKELIFTKTLSFSTPGTQTVQLPAVPEGIYRLTLISKQAEAQALIFVVTGKQSSLNLPDVTLAQYKTYYPGETARILLGSRRLTGSKRVEVYRKGQFLSTAELLPGGVSIYTYPVVEQDRGGITVGWFGASNYTFHQGSTSFTVPFDNQALSVTLETPEEVKPGKTVSWKLLAKNSQQQPVNGQASVTVYDKSLDYYARPQNPFSLGSLFAQTARSWELNFSHLVANQLSVFKGKDPYTWQEPPQLPTLNLVMQRMYYKNFRGTRGMLTAAAPMMMAKTANNVALEESMAYDLGSVESAKSADAGTDNALLQSAVSLADIRTNFAETAYFNSLLPITNGQARIKFTFPQSVTTWNILGFALTKNAEFGDFTASTITRKDFMVQLRLPRFYREQDKGILQVSVQNLTNRKITVPVTLSITQNGKDKALVFGIKTSSQTVTVGANATAYASWEITAPTAPGLYQVTASARTATASDGEQKVLPIFPSLSRLLASAHTALQNGINTLTITELNDVSDAKPELAALTINPSLALSVLNSMPNVLSSPYKDLISSLNRYVPLAVVHTFYTTYPELKEAVKKLPKRAGVTAPWNESDPLRLTMLEQTPWLQTALGQPAHAANVISLFDDEMVSKRLTQERANVLKFQNANGSFSWFVGGPEDTYLTLRALDAFSQAVQFGAKVPEAQAQKAISYIVPKIDKQLKEDKTGSASTVSYALYAAYTLSAFPANWPQMSSHKAYIQKWVDYADQQAKFMTPLGQIYAAAVYHRLGDDVKATQYLDKVLARMKYNPLTGAYFAPEAQSWVWYQDTLTTQTATLKTLLEVRPQSDKIAPMVQWLLFNRQVTSWQNPAAAAKAIFALLDVMKTNGALSSPTTYQIKWAGTQVKRSFAPFDWTEDLQWVKQGTQLTRAAYQTQITKQGKTTDFASLNVIYTSADAKASPHGVLNVARKYFIRFTENNVQKLRLVKDGDEIKVGDEVEVHLTLTADSAFEYVQLTDPKPAGFESADLHSKWTWNPVSMYQEVRDADTNFFIDRLPAGKVELRYVLRPTMPGKFHAKPAQVQSMYAPQYGAHSAAEKITVVR